MCLTMLDKITYFPGNAPLCDPILPLKEARNTASLINELQGPTIP